MKDCQWIRKNLPAFAENQLNNRDKEILRKHLGVCAGCQQYWTEYRELDRLLQDLPLEPVPEDLTKNIMAAIQPLATERRKVLQRDELSWWEFMTKGLPLLITFSLLSVISWVIYLGQKYSWQETPGIIWWRVSGGWNRFWSTLDTWGSHLTQSFYTTWHSAVRLPDDSAVTLAGGSRFIVNLVTAYRDVIQIIVLAVVVWIIIAVITAYFSSRIIFDHGEERI